MNKKTALIAIEKLGIGYVAGKQQKLLASDMSAALEPGKLICLLGENGSGKSTLLRTLGGFQAALSGQVLLNGKSLAAYREGERARYFSIVLTDRVRIQNATVFEVVAYGRSPYTGLFGKLTTKDEQIVREVIVRCGMEHKIYAQLDALSDGERQKVMIARALAQDTPIILLDEPTAFLDFPARVEVMRLLRNIVSESGKTVLLSSHDLELACRMADTLWLLPKGGPLIDGSPEELLLQNKIQEIFCCHDVKFDQRSASFQLEPDCSRQVQAVAEGLPLILLQRAFARHGVEVRQVAKTNALLYLEVVPCQGYCFRLFSNGVCVAESSSPEVVLRLTLRLMENPVLNPEPLMFMN